MKLQKEETKKRAEEDARRIRADKVLKGVLQEELKRLRNAEEEKREEEEQMLNVLKEKTLRLQKDDVNIAVYAREALMVARRAVKDLERESEMQKSAVVRRRKIKGVHLSLQTLGEGYSNLCSNSCHYCIF